MPRLVQAVLGRWALVACLLMPNPAAAQTAAPAPAASAAANTPAVRATLPVDIRWVTNDEDPPIGSAKALRGGTLNSSIDSYPLTFRLVGPNSDRKSVV